MLQLKTALAESERTIDKQSIELKETRGLLRELRHRFDRLVADGELEQKVLHEEMQARVEFEKRRHAEERALLQDEFEQTQQEYAASLEAVKLERDQAIAAYDGLREEFLRLAFDYERLEVNLDMLEREVQLEYKEKLVHSRSELLQQQQDLNSASRRQVTQALEELLQ